MSHDTIAEHAGDLAPRSACNAAGLFHAACSRDHDTEICGCPVCQEAAPYSDDR